LVALQTTDQFNPVTSRIAKAYHVKVEVGDLALAVASKCQTVGKRTDTVFSSVERLLSMMREGRFGVLRTRKRSATRTTPSSNITHRNNHLGNGQPVEQGSSTVGAVIISDMGQYHTLPASRHVNASFQQKSGSTDL
jgi:hypothetical protein